MSAERHLYDFVPKHWINLLAKKYQVHRKNLVLMLKGQIKSDRSKIIRSAIKQDLISHYEAQLNSLRNDAFASF